MKLKFNSQFDKIFIRVCVLSISVLTLAIIILILTDTGDYTETPSYPEPELEIVAEPEEEVEYIDTRPLSLFTGEHIDEDDLYRRPIAVVINNIRDAWPHSGITSADVIYEVLAEGDVTRLIGIFQSEMPETVGPIRSARDYFIDFSLNHGAIFVHHGSSPSGLDRMHNLNVARLDGMFLEGNAFWRDTSNPYWANRGTRSLEHSSYTGWENVQTQISVSNFRDYIDNPEIGFSFDELSTDLATSGSAHHITVPFSASYPRTFIFDEELNQYRVENREGPHMDALSQEQVTVANVLVQFTSIWIVDDAGRRGVATVGEGRGYLAREGYVVPVRWAKSGHSLPMHWYFENGDPVVLAPGATWINVVDNSVGITFE